MHKGVALSRIVARGGGVYVKSDVSSSKDSHTQFNLEVFAG